MCKSSFAVAIHGKKLVILGVTSIVPNLNGVLLRTENRHDYQLDNDEMVGMTYGIEYPDATTEFPDGYEIRDCHSTPTMSGFYRNHGSAILATHTRGMRTTE